VIVEFEPQTRIEGEIQQLSSDFPVIEFHRILKGEVLARNSANDLIVFDGVGFASEDFTALVFLRDLLKEQGGYEILDMIPQQADPKNLYSVVNEHSIVMNETMAI
jgi:ornithine cyclodeaminase